MCYYEAMNDDHILQRKTAEILNEAIKQKIFPGSVVGIIRKNGPALLVSSGRFTYDNNSNVVKEDTVYDVASITKSIPTSSLALHFIDKGKLRLEDTMITYLPEYQGSFRDDITLHHLLTQTLHFSFPLSSIAHLKSDEIIEKILHAKLLSVPGRSYYYVNATSILLGMVIEKVTGKSLDQAAEEIFFKPLGMTRTTFFPSGIIPPTEILPSGKSIRGVVHDESARALLPRIVGSTGLFSSASDLLRFLQMLLGRGVFEGKRFFSEELVNKMYTNQLVTSSVCVGLGWELKAAWMGEKKGASTFGKTGFTGCMVACDVEKGIGVVLLTNRTYPHRPPTGDGINQVRRDLLDTIFSFKQLALV